MNPYVMEIRMRTKEILDAKPKPRANKVKLPKKHPPTLKTVPEGAVCCYCGRKLDTSNATVDHVIPLALGGSNKAGNKVHACVWCNVDKGNKLLEEWYAAKIRKQQARTKREVN